MWCVNGKLALGPQRLFIPIDAVIIHLENSRLCGHVKV